MNELITLLPQVEGKYSEGYLLSKITWFNVGGPAQVLFKPKNSDDLSHFLKNTPVHIPVFIMGVGSNMLIRDGGISGVVIKLGSGFSTIHFNGDHVTVGAGMLDRTLAMECAQQGVAGLEFLVGIPGTIGGALRMNAGCYGHEIKDILLWAKGIDRQGQIHTFTNEDMQFSYRHCGISKDIIFTEACFKGQLGDSKKIQHALDELLATRESSQPVRSRTGGSTFKNPEGERAWELIDKAGCRGMMIGGAQVSEKHCNFLINTGTATAKEIEELGETVRKKVLEHSGVTLEWEIIRMGKQ